LEAPYVHVGLPDGTGACALVGVVPRARLTQDGEVVSDVFAVVIRAEGGVRGCAVMPAQRGYRDEGRSEAGPQVRMSPLRAVEAYLVPALRATPPDDLRRILAGEAGDVRALQWMLSLAEHSGAELSTLGPLLPTRIGRGQWKGDHAAFGSSSPDGAIDVLPVANLSAADPDAAIMEGFSLGTHGERFHFLSSWFFSPADMAAMDVRFPASYVDAIVRGGARTGGDMLVWIAGRVGGCGEERGTMGWRRGQLHVRRTAALCELGRRWFECDGRGEFADAFGRQRSRIVDEGGFCRSAVAWQLVRKGAEVDPSGLDSTSRAGLFDCYAELASLPAVADLLDDSESRGREEVDAEFKALERACRRRHGLSAISLSATSAAPLLGPRNNPMREHRIAALIYAAFRLEEGAARECMARAAVGELARAVGQWMGPACQDVEAVLPTVRGALLGERVAREIAETLWRAFLPGEAARASLPAVLAEVLDGELNNDSVSLVLGRLLARSWESFVERELVADLAAGWDAFSNRPCATALVMRDAGPWLLAIPSEAQLLVAYVQGGVSDLVGWDDPAGKPMPSHGMVDTAGRNSMAETTADRHPALAAFLDASQSAGERWDAYFASILREAQPTRAIGGAGTKKLEYVVCWGCGISLEKAAARMCSKCHKASYCLSKDCQARHWEQSHKIECGLILGTNWTPAEENENVPPPHNNAC